MRKLQESEARTAGNALGQGWGLLNNRAMSATLKRVDAAGLHDCIYPIAAIHDATYYMIKNNPNLLSWFNSVITEEITWQNHPDIEHAQVNLEGELDIFYPDWSSAITLNNSISIEELIKLLKVNNILKEIKNE